MQELQSTPRKASLSQALPQSPHSSNGEGGELRAANQQVWQLRAQLEAAQKVQPYRPFLDTLAEGSRGQALKVHSVANPRAGLKRVALLVEARVGVHEPDRIHL